MLIRKTIFTVCFLWLCTDLLAQQTSVQFKAVFGTQDLIISEQTFKRNDGEEIQISALKFYCSKFRFWQNDVMVWEENNSYHLIDCANESSTSVVFEKIPQKAYNRITFSLGIDSLTNMSGALGNDLDPSKGMYWTWQSGYINFKLEGKHPLSATHDKEFQFHLGGYQVPYNSIQNVTLNITPEQNTIIYLDVVLILKQIDWMKKSNIMSPCTESVQMMHAIAQTFSTVPLR